MGEHTNTVAVAGALVLVAIAAGAGIGLMRRPPHAGLSAEAALPIATDAEDPTTSIDVHVAGWVNNPGVVSVEEGSITADAISAAGGMRPGAAVDTVNLAAPLVDGQQIVVAGPEGSEGAPAASDTGLISLNRATETDLETLPGVGPVLAGRIVSFRETHGPFEQVEDLLQVPGIGEAKLASLRDLVQP